MKRASFSARMLKQSEAASRLLTWQRLCAVFTQGDISVLGNCLRARADVELFVDAADIRADRRQADCEGISDFFVEITAGKQIQNFAFARRQFVCVGRRGGRGLLLKRLNDFSRDVTGHGRAAGMDLLESG